jgi:hypothetical protein
MKIVKIILDLAWFAIRLAIRVVWFLIVSVIQSTATSFHQVRNDHNEDNKSLDKNKLP